METAWAEITRTDGMKIDQSNEDGRLRITDWCDLNGRRSEITLELPEEIRAAIAEVTPMATENERDQALSRMAMLKRGVKPENRRSDSDPCEVPVAPAAPSGTWKPCIIDRPLDVTLVDADGVTAGWVRRILLLSTGGSDYPVYRLQCYYEGDPCGKFDDMDAAKRYIEELAGIDTSPAPATIQRARWQWVGESGNSTGGILDEFRDAETGKVLAWVECNGPMGNPSTIFTGRVGDSMETRWGLSQARYAVIDMLGFSKDKDGWSRGI